MNMRFSILITLATLCLSTFSLTACAQDIPQGCERKTFSGARYSICTFMPAQNDIRLFLKSDSGQTYGSFDAVNAALAPNGQQLVFAMNAGMYHANRSPVGGYIEAGRDITPVNTHAGPGNFHMLPNGVFWLSKSGYGGGWSAHVGQTADYQSGAHFVKYATQSGPMLVIGGKLHPRFIASSSSRKIRNGVGIGDDGALIFVKSEDPVNFHSFATLFRDDLGANNALYLDGTISRLYSLELGRNDRGASMGPIVGVVRKSK